MMDNITLLRSTEKIRTFKFVVNSEKMQEEVNRGRCALKDIISPPGTTGPGSA